MISSSDIVDAFVTVASTISGFVAIMTPLGGSSPNILGYNDEFPADDRNANLNRAINALAPPGCLVAWMGTAPGEVNRNEMYKHRLRAHIRIGPDSGSVSYGDTFKALIDGVPTGSTVKLLNSFIHPNCLPMEVPSANRKIGTNGLEYLAVDIILPEIGDN